MKIRQGFVSNSSSSSFVCDITNYSFEGYDGQYDVDYIACENGHEFAFEREPSYEKDFPELYDYLYNTPGVDYYSIPADKCVICNGKAKSQIVERIKNDLLRLKITIEDLK